VEEFTFKVAWVRGTGEEKLGRMVSAAVREAVNRFVAMIPDESLPMTEKASIVGIGVVGSGGKSSVEFTSGFCAEAVENTPSLGTTRVVRRSTPDPEGN
jgi:hypothetical protein